MGTSINRIAAYLQSLPAGEYGIPAPVAGALNFLVDSFFAKKLDFESKNYDPTPGNVENHAKETWLGCEIHKVISLNRSFNIFQKPQIAWAFSKLLDGSKYVVVPFLDGYEYKDIIKNMCDYKIQRESILVGPKLEKTLVVAGSFFIVNELREKFIVNIDLSYFNYGCSVTILAAPQDQKAAEKFLADLNTSIDENNIYFGQCMSFLQGRLEFLDVRKTRWEEIILKPDVVREIRDNSVDIIKNMDKLSGLGMVPKRNVILISPPGMAKTTVFRAISEEMAGTTRIWCTGKSISEASNVTSLFEAARSLAPCIVFIEDMDLFGQSRDKCSSFENQVLNEFLACLDGMHQNSGIVIMASTNDISAMDQALVNRPKRFDVKIEIPYPDAIDRSRILLSCLRRLNANNDGSVSRESMKVVIDLTDGLTGAYIEDLAESTVIRAVSKGNIVDGQVMFSIDDLNAAAEQTVKNYRIGKSAAAQQQ